MWRKQPIAAALAALHWALIAAAYGRLAAKAFLHFPTDWDFLAYHLPGALAAWGLTSYTPEPRLVAVIAGFPPLPRIVEGALVLATGPLLGRGRAEPRRCRRARRGPRSGCTGARSRCAGC